MAFIKNRTSDEQAIITAKYMVNGRHTVKKTKADSFLYKWFKGLSVEFGRVEQALRDWMDGRNIVNETTFLTEYESTVGIPDGKFNAIGTALERQRQVIGKLAAEGVTSDIDLEWLCSLLGFVVDVKSGKYYWLNPDSSVSLATQREASFTIVFKVFIDEGIAETDPNYFPVSFPWQFRASNYNAMRKFLTDIIPANCNALFFTQQSVYKDVYGSTDVYKDVYGVSDVYKDEVL